MRTLTLYPLTWLIIYISTTMLCFAEDLSTTNRGALGHFWQTAEEKVRPVTVLSFGDSMADSYRSPSYYLMGKLEARLGTAGYSLNGYQNKTLWQLSNGATNVSYSPFWFTDHLVVPPNGILWWANQASSGGIKCDEAGIFYVRQPGGGIFTLSVSTNGGPWTVALVLDGYSASPVGCLTNLNLPLNQYRLRIDGISGTNYILGPHLLMAHTNGVHVAFMDQGGISLSQVTNIPISIRAPIFEALKPDFLVWHMKEPLEPLRACMEACETWWTNAFPDCEVVYIGTPNAIQDLTELATTNQNLIVRDVAAKHGRTYVDMMQPGISYANLTANGLLSADGVHLTNAGGQWGAAIIWNDLNLFALGLPRSLALQRVGGFMRITFNAVTNANYGLESSANLVDWSSIFTVNGSGNFQVSVPVTAPAPQFYRLSLTPN